MKFLIFFLISLNCFAGFGPPINKRLSSTDKALLIWDGTTGSKVNEIAPGADGDVLSVVGGLWTSTSASAINASIAAVQLNVDNEAATRNAYDVSLQDQIDIHSTSIAAIEASYVSSINGTANQVLVSATTGGITASLPQDIALTSTPTFAGINLTDSLVLTQQSTPATPNTGKNKIYSKSDKKLYTMSEVGNELEIAVTTPTGIAYVENQQATTVGGGTATAATWNIITLNTINGDSGIITASGSGISLGAGVYTIEAFAPAWGTNKTKLRLYNTTDSTTALLGMALACESFVNNVTCFSSINDIMTITSTKRFELQLYSESTVATIGLGKPANDGTVEKYARIKITKLPR